MKTKNIFHKGQWFVVFLQIRDKLEDFAERVKLENRYIVSIPVGRNSCLVSILWFLKTRVILNELTIDNLQWSGKRVHLRNK
jgi:hypothetical protein